MAPTTCSGFSAASAARNFAPADSGAGVEAVMCRAVYGCADPYDGATRDFSVDVGLEAHRQVGERDGAADDALRVAAARSPAMRCQTSSRSARGVADELMPSRFTPRRMKGMTVVFELRAARQPDARDVSPEIHVRA